MNVCNKEYTPSTYSRQILSLNLGHLQEQKDLALINYRSNSAVSRFIADHAKLMDPNELWRYTKQQ